jgi:hypothetical protein
LLPSLHDSLEKLYTLGADKAYEKVKSVFVSTMKGKPFYRDLVIELLQEEFSAEASALREQSLSVLTIQKEKPLEGRKKPDYRIILVEAVRLMLPAGSHLKDALRKIMTNQELLEKSRRRWSLRSWLRKTFQSRELRATVELRYFDSRTSATQIESIDFQKFVEGVRRKISLFAALSQPDSTSFARLSAASEQQIDGFLKKNLGELQLLHRRLQGLNEGFRQETPKEQKDQLKGIKIELSGLKNGIVRANRIRYEYVSLKEEEVRLQQLGVAD